MPPRPVSTRLTVSLVVFGLVLAAAPALYASFAICGVSGCTGGGFGRSTDPGGTLVALAVTGVVAAAPLAIYAIVRRSGALGVGTLALAVLTTLVTGAVIGSDLRGCPRNVPHETCLDESR
ncbi:hypothetical protein L2K70_14650 [Nocardioides KLBMP 9356]|uniref:Uncharacterized protein n=1 Tax=Nocardioides potassii TaxID=2911371 RepID=A0ABS9HES9_9ACTN|nr:hypothetical protein [Nocardioides potassii]MCF6378852.1 hypothetical protein [Nocardioides potassii]